MLAHVWVRVRAIMRDMCTMIDAIVCNRQLIQYRTWMTASGTFLISTPSRTFSLANPSSSITISTWLSEKKINTHHRVSNC